MGDAGRARRRSRVRLVRHLALLRSVGPRRRRHRQSPRLPRGRCLQHAFEGDHTRPRPGRRDPLSRRRDRRPRRREGRSAGGRHRRLRRPRPRAARTGRPGRRPRRLGGRRDRQPPRTRSRAGHRRGEAHRGCRGPRHRRRELTSGRRRTRDPHHERRRPPCRWPGIPLPPSTDALEPTDAALAVLSATWDQAMHGVTTTANAAAMSLGTAVSSFVPGAGAPARNGSVPPGAPTGGGGLLGPTLDPTSFFSSGAGFSFGAGAVLAFGLFAAHRAWVLRRRPEDDSALPAPVFATDVSPD